MTEISSLVAGRFKRLARRSAEIWQGGLVKMPMWIGAPGDVPVRPWGAVWVSRETDMVNIKLAEGPPDAGVALDALFELGLKFTRTRPAGIEVVDPALGDAIARGAGDSELAVHVVDDIALVRDKLGEMVKATEGRPLPPDALRARGVTVERMRAFAGAARELFEAAPWRHLTDEDLIRIEAPAVNRSLSCATVLGAAGQVFGVGFFASPRELEQLHEDADPETLIGPRGRWSVLFGPIHEMPFGDVDLWEEHALPVAGPSAYPVAIWFGPNGRLRRPEGPMLAELEAILRALARATEDEIDSGRWSRDVPTADGPRRLTLALPELLQPLDAPVEPRAGSPPDRRAMERVLLEVQRFAAGKSFDSADELNASIQREFSGALGAVPSTASTPLERAQDLAYRAVEARGRRRVQLARRALEISPDCADAYVLLAEAATERPAARDLYARGVAAGERALGPTAFTEDAGHFWSMITTRPYMRARFGLARSLQALGERDAAVDHYRELLRLNPGDNQGVRYSLLAVLLEAGRDAEAEALLEQFHDEGTAAWAYAWALHAFRRGGDAAPANERLRRAVRANRHAPGYLLGKQAGAMPDAYALGSHDEAVVIEDMLGDLWRATPGAERWLAARARPARGGKRRKG
jgi:tetratricopeptide (TPR) repeat protein